MKERKRKNTDKRKKNHKITQEKNTRKYKKQLYKAKLIKSSNKILLKIQIKQESKINQPKSCFFITSFVANKYLAMPHLHNAFKPYFLRHPFFAPTFSALYPLPNQLAQNPLQIHPPNLAIFLSTFI